MQRKNMKKISVLLLFSILISLFSNVVSALKVNGEAVESVGQATQQDVTIGEISQDETLETGDNAEGFLANSTFRYGVTPENDVTLLMSEKTVFSEFKQKLGSDKVLNITRDGSEIPSDDIIRTGDIISINGEESIAEVIGDVDGDGIITSTDYLQIKKYFLKTFDLEGAYFSAGDTDNNGNINSTDYIQVKSYFLKIYNFFEVETEIEETLAEEMFLPKCGNDFSFLVNFNGSLSELLENVKVYHVVDDVNIPVNYSVAVDGESVYRISPETTYENYEIYTVELSGDASFVDYKAKSITFEVGGPDKENIDFENNIIFLKNLESLSPGYYPYTISFDEEKELYTLTLSKGDGFTDELIGKILAVGDYSSEAEVLADSSKELYFGKIQKIYQSGKSTIVEMTAPELDELFATLDVFTNQYSGDMAIEFNEDLENEIVGAIQESDAFVEHIAAANLAAKDYALEHGVVAVDLVGKSFKDYFDFELTKKEFMHHDGGYCTVDIEGKLTCTIPLKTTGGTDVGSIKITCTAGIKSDIWFYGHCNTKDMHLGVTTKTTVTLGFNLTIKAEASLNDEMHYYVNRTTKTIHTSTCRYVEKVIDVSHMDVYTAKALLNLYPDMDAMKKDECKVCKAVSGLDGTAYVLNISSNTLHCLNCIHVTTIANHNVFEIYPEHVDGYNLCEDCKPQEREAKDFEQRMLNRMQGGDWAAEVEKLRSLMQNSGNASNGNGKGMDIGEVPFKFLGVFDFRLTLELVCNFDLEATIDCSFTFYSEDQFGVRVDHKNSSTYHNQVDKWDKKTIDVTGKVDLELGLNIHINASIIGLKDCISVYLDAGTGVYAMLSGVLHFESGTAENLDNYYAAYFEMGFYYDISGGFKLFKWGKEITIIEGRVPILQRGYERAYYSFENYAPTLDITFNYTHLGNTDVLGVEYFNVKELKKETAKLNPEGDAQYYVKYAFKNADGTINPYFSYGQGGIKISDDAPKTFTAYMEITVVPKYAPVSSMSEFLSQDYKNGSSVFFLDTLTVELNVKDVGLRVDYYLDPLKANLTDGVLTIWGKGDMPDYSSYSDVPWYNEREKITKVVIKKGVTSIGDCAFALCSYLASITIPDSVTSIGDYAFCWRDSLASITIPDSVTSIGDYAFFSCDSLVSVTIPDSVTSIGDYAFANCSSLASIVVSSGNKVYHSKNNCLIETKTKILIKGCKNSIIPTDGSVTSIGDSAFYSCDSLVSINIPDSVTSIGDGAFGWCDALASITIPDSVASIGSDAFSGCTSLASITIPKSVMSIGWGAFDDCVSLESVIFENPNGWYVTKTNGESSGTKVTVTNKSTAADYLTDTYEFYYWYRNSDSGKNYDLAPLKANLTDGVLTIWGEGDMPDYSSNIDVPWYNERDKITEVVIMNGVTSIGDYAFYSCDSLESITSGDSVTSIGDSAFEDCYSLESITIGDSVTSIGDSAFAGCVSLVSVTIPDSVNSIGDRAFACCASLASVTIPDGVTSIGDCAFDCCYSLENIVVSSGNKVYHSTNNCLIETSTKTLILGCKNSVIPTDGSVTSIGDSAFCGCDSITSIIIPEGVTSIGDNAFTYCFSLVSITIPDSVTSIGDWVFAYCSSLVSINIPDSVTSIGDGAFGWCDALASITIPNSVTSIGYGAFYGCSYLESVIFEDPYGWYVTNTKGVSSGVTVTNKSTAADYLTNTYCWYYYWDRK